MLNDRLAAGSRHLPLPRDLQRQGEEQALLLPPEEVRGHPRGRAVQGGHHQEDGDNYITFYIANCAILLQVRRKYLGRNDTEMSFAETSTTSQSQAGPGPDTAGEY